MTATLHSIVLDVPDVRRVAEFYATLTGWEASGDESWTDLVLPDGRRVGLQSAPDHVAPRWPDPDHPQQVHLDLLTPDIEAAATRAGELGATRLAAVDAGGSAWVTLADPAGHPFDLCRREGAGDGVATPMGMFGVCLDTQDPATLSRFYATLLGVEVKWEGDEGAMLEQDASLLYFQRVERHVRPQWPDPAHPQQGHLDIRVTDLDATSKVALAAGATRLPGGDETCWVFADPSGHPFCLFP